MKCKPLQSRRCLIMILLPLLLASGIAVSTLQKGNYIQLVPAVGTYLIDQEFTIAVAANAEDMINAVSLEVTYPVDKLIVKSINTDHSIINLWAEKPREQDGVVYFSGVILEGFEGTGEVASITFLPYATDEVHLDIIDAALLAHDGKGTDVLDHTYSGNYHVHVSITPSPDLNGDGVISVVDFSIMIFYWGEARDKSVDYDLNQDGWIDLTDLSILASKYIYTK